MGTTAYLFFFVPACLPLHAHLLLAAYMWAPMTAPMFRDMINGMVCMKMVWDSSSTGTETRLWTGQLRNYGSIPGRGMSFFCSQQCLDCTQPLIQWVLRVKWLRCEADNSPPSSAKVNNNSWSYTSSAPYAFLVWCVIKHRDNFSFKGGKYVNNICKI